MNELVLLVEYTAKPGEREAFLAEVNAAGIPEKIHAEEGCICYRYYLDTEDENKILLVEKWESEAHQQKHLQTPHMAELKNIKEKHVVNTTLEKIEKKSL